MPARFSIGAPSCATIPAWIAAARADPATRYLLTAGAAQLVTGGAVDGDRLPRRAITRWWLAARDEDLTLLGWFRGARCVLVEVHDARARRRACPRTRELRELRPLAPLLPPDSASLLAYARALALWKARHRHCGVCGAPNLPARAGHVMRCSRAGCGTEAFPRLDPAIIVLVTDADRRTRLVRPAGIVARGPLLDHRRLRRTRRKPRRRGGARSGGGNRRAGRRRRIRRLAALAIPFVADAGIPRGRAHP